QVQHFAALAAGRVALQGARHDALARVAREALGLSRSEAPLAPRPALTLDAVAPALASARQWLMELAIAGFDNLDEDTLTPFAASLEALEGEPELAGIAALLAGLWSELSAAAAHSSGGPNAPRPSYRWADLWAAAFTGCQRPMGREAGAEVSGIFHPLGVEVQSHPTFAQAVFHGVWEQDGERRVARVPWGSFKVPAIAGEEIWVLFQPAIEVWLKALEAGKSVAVEGLWRSTGELLPRTAKAGKKLDPFALAASLATIEPPPPLAPEARHPVQLAELVHLPEVSVREEGGELVVTPGEVPLALERLFPGCELERDTLASAEEIVGLLRFDGGGFRLQPLAARGGKLGAGVVTGQEARARAAKLKSKTLAILEERAGKLLRG
ncbi:MAG: hypothetical protein KC731_11490, partial [Myxococcales bacterium]|nr:hypothetical protein [Myxococcales bacterium]